MAPYLQEQRRLLEKFRAEAEGSSYSVLLSGGGSGGGGSAVHAMARVPPASMTSDMGAIPAFSTLEPITSATELTLRSSVEARVGGPDHGEGASSPSATSSEGAGGGQ